MNWPTLRLLREARECVVGVEPYDDKKEKQDCEINAFKRMAPVLKSLMKRYFGNI